MAWALGELFQSTPPARGATGILESFIGLVGFNPRPPRGGRLVSVRKCWHSEIVSIHAPRAGGDWAAFVPTYFSSEFQSTPPARGATRRRPHRRLSAERFNPRPLRGGRRQSCGVVVPFQVFQS